MSANPAAEKAAVLIASHGASEADISHHSGAYKEAVSFMTDIIEAAIDAETARYKPLVEALRHIRNELSDTLNVEPMFLSPEEVTEGLIVHIDAALAGFEAKEEALEEYDTQE